VVAIEGIFEAIIFPFDPLAFLEDLLFDLVAFLIFGFSDLLDIVYGLIQKKVLRNIVY
jgi:hypothetical protein